MKTGHGWIFKMIKIDVVLTSEQITALRLNNVSESDFKTKIETMIDFLLRKEIYKAKHFLTKNKTVDELEQDLIDLAGGK